MAPRRGAVPGEPSLTIASLTDDLLARCLAPLSQEERFKHAALVSKRFRAACLEPQRLHTIIARILGGQVLARLRSLLAFLVKHAAHVRKLELDLSPPDYPAPSDPEERELAALVVGCLSACSTAGCLPACSTAGCLEELTVKEETPLPSTEWLPGLTALQRLVLGNLDEPLRLPPGVSQLRALSDATLAGSPLQLEGALPGGLTHLSLQDYASRQLPAQVLQLSKLAHLELWNTDYEAASLAPMSSLASLRRLALYHGACLPLCLSTLTQLDCLVSDRSDGQGDAATLAAALPHLSQLTCLAIFSNHLESIPPSITRLTQLQRLYFFSNAGRDLSLPPGAWLASLRWLGLPWEALEASVSALQAAQRLQYLSSLLLPAMGDEDEDDEEGVNGGGSKRWRACWDFIATHPPLRCFGIDHTASVASMAVVDALLDLRHRRPALSLRRTARNRGLTFWAETLDCMDIPKGAG